MSQFSQFVKVTVLILLLAVLIPFLGYFCLLIGIALAVYVKNIPTYVMQLPEAFTDCLTSVAWGLWWTVTHPIEVVIAIAIPILVAAYYWPESEAPKFPDRHIHRGSRLGPGPKARAPKTPAASPSPPSRRGHQPTILRGSRVGSKRN